MAKKRKNSKGSDELERNGSVCNTEEGERVTGEGLGDGVGSSVPMEEVPDLRIAPLNEKQKSNNNNLGQNSEGKKKKKKNGSDEAGVNNGRDGSNDNLGMGERGVKQEYSNGVSRGSELDAESIKKKKRKRDRVVDDAGQDVDYRSSTGRWQSIEAMEDGSNDNNGIGERGANQEYSNGVSGGTDLDAESIKKKKRKRNHVADDVGQDVVDYRSSTGRGQSIEAMEDGSNDNNGIGERGANQDYSNGVSGGTELDAESIKKKKRKRNHVADDVGQDVVDYRSSTGRGQSIEAMEDGSNDNIGIGERGVKQDYSNGVSGGAELDANSITKKKRKRGRVGDDAGIDVDYPSSTGRGDSIAAIGDGEGLDRSSGGLGIQHSDASPRKKKKDRNREVGIAKGEASILLFERQTDSMEKKKGDSKTKKIVRFQEALDEIHTENVTYISREKDVDDDVAFFSEDRNWKTDIVRLDLRYGKFTKEEDEKIKDSVFKYIKMRGWDAKEGLETILHPSQRPDARGCWLEIAKCLPIRPVKQINSRAIRLLGGHTRGKWSADEEETLKNLHEIHGNNWKKIASHMERSAGLCKDKWRHTRLLPTRKAGYWGQDEYDKLSKLVRRSLRVKASTPAKSLDRRQLRDDINWEWIAEEMQRDCSRCARIWYERVASPMVSAEKWANGDDHLLLQRLMELGAASEEALDWDTILDHRDGEICLRRWTEMTRLLGKSDHISFEDKVEFMAKRYAPDLLGIEEEW